MDTTGSGRGAGTADAVIFDMDGVVTDTAAAHFDAWKAVFDDFLRWRGGGDAFRPFTIADYLAHVDGVPRADGVRRFLASRGIELPEGQAGEEVPATVQSLATLKNRTFRAWLERGHVPVYEDARALIGALRRQGIRVGIFSASRNMGTVLASAGIAGLFDAMVDGADAQGLGLAPKPDPATLVETARRLGAGPARTVAVEDAVAGVAAGRAGGFALVVGVNRQHEDAAVQDRALRAHGADVVVDDLRRLLTADGERLAPLGRIAPPTVPAR